MDSLDDQECSHVIQTKQEYETLLDQRNRAKREKEETERAAAREISRVKQEAAHEADRAAQRVQAQIDDLLQQSKKDSLYSSGCVLRFRLSYVKQKNNCCKKYK